jgi:hypothetical protein
VSPSVVRMIDGMNSTQRMFALYDAMPLVELADMLETLDGQRTASGWTPREATHRQSIERRIVDLVTTPREEPSGAPIRCDVELRLRSKTRIGPAKLVGVAPGGVVVLCDGRFPLGTVLDLEILHDTEERGLRVRGSVCAVVGNRIRVRLLRARSEADERRLRRFVMEGLRHRTAWNEKLGLD